MSQPLQMPPSIPGAGAVIAGAPDPAVQAGDTSPSGTPSGASSATLFGRLLASLAPADLSGNAADGASPTALASPRIEGGHRRTAAGTKAAANDPASVNNSLLQVLAGLGASFIVQAPLPGSGAAASTGNTAGGTASVTVNAQPVRSVQAAQGAQGAQASVTHAPPATARAILAAVIPADLSAAPVNPISERLSAPSSPASAAAPASATATEIPIAIPLPPAASAGSSHSDPLAQVWTPPADGPRAGAAPVPLQPVAQTGGQQAPQLIQTLAHAGAADGVTTPVPPRAATVVAPGGQAVADRLPDETSAAAIPVRTTVRVSASGGALPAGNAGTRAESASSLPSRRRTVSRP